MKRQLTGDAFFEVGDVAYPAKVIRAVVRPDGLVLEIDGTVQGAPYRIEANLTRHGNACSGLGEMLEDGHVTERCTIALQSTFLSEREWELGGDLTFHGDAGPDEPIGLELELVFIE